MVAMGVLKWVDWTVSEPRYFQLQTDHTPVHLALLDEVGAAGPGTVHGESPLNAVVSATVRQTCNKTHFPQADWLNASSVPAAARPV